VTPRADVGGGGLSGALMVVFILIQDRSLYDFNILVVALLCEWAMLGSNQRPLPCEGRPANIAAYYTTLKTRLNECDCRYDRRKRVLLLG
jgi:hypothetical protein